MVQMKPTKVQERILSLDVLRGVSLLGIFLVNIMAMHSPWQYYNPIEWWEYEDATLYAWLDVLVQGSFYPIFAMMFGYGLMIMWQRSQERGISFGKIGVRRLLALLFIGIIHAFLIWSGDILINYALFGLILLSMLRLSGKLLIWLGMGIFLLVQIPMSGLMLLAAVFEPKEMTFWMDITSVTNSINFYSSGSFIEIMGQRFADWYMVNGPQNIFFLLFMILPMMMIGAGASKLQWLQNAQEQKVKWLVILLLSLVVGLPIKLLPYLIEPNLGYMVIQDMLGGPILGFAFAALIVLLMTNKQIAKVLKPFATAGRMSLTIYLSQSIIGTLIFYSYGLGLYNQISLVNGTLLALAIYVLQVVFAEIWFTKFRYGPVEKLWRTMTYGRKAVARKIEA